ncbi:MAG TPA: YbaK/EbsC family protein [Actinomycetales bacterium]|nr:YbaK/EbsC family protein [Actinomycetales bacterium]
MIGDLAWVPVAHRPDLLAPPVAAALSSWDGAGRVQVAEIDPDLADTATLIEAHGVPAGASANCVVVAGRRGGELRVAACVVAATTRADVNTVVRKALDVRKASFLPADDAVAASGMEYGGITPIGLPAGWRLLVDAAVLDLPMAVIGSGVRRSKLALPGELLATLPDAEGVAGLGRVTW